MRLPAGFLAVILLVAAAASPVLAQGPRFYPDDPLRSEPTPVPVADVKARLLSELLEQVKNSLRKTGERHPANGVIPASAVNTLGEVMDGDWYVNRHAARRMTIEELQRGPGNGIRPPHDRPGRSSSSRPSAQSGHARRRQQEQAVPPAVRSDSGTKASPPAQRW